MKRKKALLLIPFLLLSATALAQNGNFQTDYANLALQFSSQFKNGDAATGYFPTTASAEGFGSYLNNPASIALVGESYFDFSLANNQYDYQNEFLGNTLNTTENYTKFGSLGFVYKLPTVQGSFVIGGGYNSIIDQKRIDEVRGRNSQSTITDAFREPESDYYDIAYNAYATDWGDVDSTYLESIFRIGFVQFPGIDQNAYINYSTDLGEYAFFMGTEIQKNLFFGVSAGLLIGDYKYRRDFLEVDSQNDYNGNFIPSDINAEDTDIDNILTHDEVDANIISLSLRTGIIYKIAPWFSAGLSYKIPSTIRVSELYYSSITTELDDGSTPFESDFANSEAYEYRIKNPGVISAGFSISGIKKFSLAASAEYIDYSNLSLDLITGNNFGFDSKFILNEEEDNLASYIRTNYKSVLNLKTSVGYTFNKAFKVKAGYAHMPAKSKIYESSRDIVSAGFSTEIAEKVILNINGQYSFWDDRSVLYEYYDYSANTPRSEVIDQKISVFRFLAGVRFLF